MVRSWRRRLTRFAKLPPFERRLVLRALILHAGVRLKLWRQGLGVGQSVASHLSEQDSAFAGDVDPRRLARLVSNAIREAPLRSNCLSESITVCLLLRQSGHDCTLRIGARRSTAGVEAHAWVEMNGVPLNDREDIAERFAPFPATSEPVLRWVV